MNKSDTITKIAGALLAAQKEMGNAIKDSKNPFFKSSFATLNAVREACIPVLNKNGVSVFQPTTEMNGKLYVETLLLHESGEYISGLYEVVAGKQNDPQAFGAAVSYSRRYSLSSMVNIGSEDDDGESAMGRTSKPVLTNKTITVGPSTTTTIVTDKLTTVDIEKATVDLVVPKKGFGVKKAEVKVEESTEEWS